MRVADFTDMPLKALKSKDERYDRLVAEVLVLRIAHTGKIAYRHSYKLNGSRYTVALGAWPSVSRKELRALHKQSTAKLTMGLNPGG